MTRTLGTFRVLLLVGALAIGAVAVLVACGTELAADVDPEQVDAQAVPEVGACRVLEPRHVAQPDNATRTVDCASTHTAETYAAGELPGSLKTASYTSSEVARISYDTCSAAFEKFLGATESLVMRSVLSWAWFRPSEKAWEEGARWYRCDVIGSIDQNGDKPDTYLPLPKTARKLLLGKQDDQWMVCANGREVATSPKVPCTQKHTWRAVTTIKAGAEDAPYPGDRLVEVTTRDYCKKSVGAWLGYPDSYPFGYTWFHEAEWEAGNRRSICWARTHE